MKKSAYKNYSEFVRDVNTLYDTIKEDYKPDYILGIATGGLFLSKLMYEKFKKPLGILFLNRYRKEKAKKITIGSLGTFKEPQGNVLVLDDICDKGETLIACVGYIRRIFPKIKNVKTAVLHLKQGSKIKPDYYIYDITESIWIDYFWEVGE